MKNRTRFASPHCRDAQLTTTWAVSYARQPFSRPRDALLPMTTGHWWSTAKIAYIKPKNTTVLCPTTIIRCVPNSQNSQTNIHLCMCSTSHAEFNARQRFHAAHVLCRHVSPETCLWNESHHPRYVPHVDSSTTCTIGRGPLLLTHNITHSTQQTPLEDSDNHGRKKAALCDDRPGASSTLPSPIRVHDERHPLWRFSY